MSLERKDLRVYFDADIHAGLRILADQQRIDLHELAERIVRDFVLDRIHDCIVIAEKAERALDRIHVCIVIAEKAERAGLVRMKAVSSGSSRSGPA